MKLNHDVLFHTLEFMEPDPVTFCRLALVSQDFYRVFTSDRAWRPLDVYDCKTNIYHSFKENTSSGSLGKMMSYWQAHTIVRFNSKLSGPSNKADLFALLGYIIHASQDMFRKNRIHVGNRRVLDLAIRIRSSAAKWASLEILQERDFAFEAVKNNGCILEYFPDTIKQDREIVLRAIVNDCPKDCAIHRREWSPVLAICNDDTLRDNIEVAWAAVRTNPMNVIYVSEALALDRDLVLHALSRAGCLLEVVHGNWRDDEEMVLTAIEPKECERCSQRRKECLAIQFASERLRNDPKFMKEAISINVNCFPFISPKLIPDNSFLRLILEVDPEQLALRMGDVSSDSSLLELALERKPELFQFCPEFVRTDKQRAMNAVGHDGLLLASAVGLEDDFDVALRAVRNDGMALQFVSKRLRGDPKIVSAAIRQTPTSLMYVQKPHLVARSISAMLVANIELEELKLCYNIAKSSQAYRDIVDAVLVDKVYFIRFIKKMQTDEDCMKAAVWSFADAPFWMNHKLLKNKAVVEQLQESQKHVGSEHYMYTATYF